MCRSTGATQCPNQTAASASNALPLSRHDPRAGHLTERAARARERARPTNGSDRGCVRSILLVGRHSPKTKSKPKLTRSITRPGNARTWSVSSPRSSVSICDTLTTDGLGSPESLLLNRTFPGASANARLEEMTNTTTVEIRLKLKGFDCTTRTGRRRPGPEPTGSSSDAHQTSPRFMSQRSHLRTHQRGVNSRIFPAIDLVELCSDSRGTSSLQELRQRLGIELATRHAQLLRQHLRGIEHCIWQRDGDFHGATVSPRYDRRKAMPNRLGGADRWRERLALAHSARRAIRVEQVGCVDASWTQRDARAAVRLLASGALLCRNVRMGGAGLCRSYLRTIPPCPSGAAA